MGFNSAFKGLTNTAGHIYYYILCNEPTLQDRLFTTYRQLSSNKELILWSSNL